MSLYLILPKISSNTGSVNDIIKGEMSDSLGLLQQQGERLTNTASGTTYADFNHDDKEETEDVIFMCPPAFDRFKTIPLCQNSAPTTREVDLLVI